MWLRTFIEKVAARYPEEHWKHNGLNGSYQSVYRRDHSTETVFLKVHSDIADTLDQGSITALVILYLSAAFEQSISQF